ncbi:MAG: response regulator [Balneolaceae bacterium]
MVNLLPLRILLTDDDEGDRLLFKEIIEEMNTETVVHTLKNGVELMNYLNENHKSLPALLFLDLNIPLKSGMECLKEIRGNSKFDSIAIAIYSTSSFDKDIDRTFDEGANIYITKPSDFQTLKKVLTKAVSFTRQEKDSGFNKENFVLKI